MGDDSYGEAWNPRAHVPLGFLDAKQGKFWRAAKIPDGAWSANWVWYTGTLHRTSCGARGWSNRWHETWEIKPKNNLGSRTQHGCFRQQQSSLQYFYSTWMKCGWIEEPIQLWANFLLKVTAGVANRGRPKLLAWWRRVRVLKRAERGDHFAVQPGWQWSNT